MKLLRTKLLVGDVLKRIKKIPDESINLIISSPPYNIGKSYEKDSQLSVNEYCLWQKEVLQECRRVLTKDGNICWQVGNYVKNDTYIPLDILFYPIFKDLGFILRNRIIWRFNFGRNLVKKFSGRYEVVLWFSKTDNYLFNLDPIRIPQLYPGKRHSKNKGDKAGQPSGNPKGKNPSDYWEFSAEQDFKVNPIWDIPNVKAAHKEKTTHPCQFPVALAERCVLAFTKENDVVLDPFVGVGSSVIAAVNNKRIAIGIDKEKEYIDIAKKRLELLSKNLLPIRNIAKPVIKPNVRDRVARIPDEWKD